MAEEGRSEIVAVVTTDRDAVGGGGVPFIYVATQDELLRVTEVLKSPLGAVPAQVTSEMIVLIHHP